MDDVIELNVDGVRDLMDTLSSQDFVLVDVREREEYLAGHLAGAILLPLMEVLSAPGEVPTARHTIFYCRSGRRSLHAAMVVGRVQNLENVYNMTGGILDWRGETLLGLPTLQVFGAASSLRDLLRRAIELEKGGQLLYSAFAKAASPDPVVGVFASLVDDETRHAQSIYDVAADLDGPGLPPFETLFASLEGQLLESGESYQEIARHANRAEDRGGPDLLELSLEMELKALDLYLNAAHQAPDEVTRTVLLKLADEEKHHAHKLLHALADHA